jgi:hypothetical protein
MSPVDCKCEPCPFDIRQTKYVTRKEDPAFEGTRCLWHEVIEGARGSICVSGKDSNGVLFYCDLSELTPKRLRGAGLSGMNQCEFRLSELDNYANLIGAKLQ